MKFNNNEEAVSPVIGVILMVAITVILAAVIAVFVFGMADSMETSHNVAMTAKTVNATAVTFTFQGGPDAGIVNTINFVLIDENGATKDFQTTNYVEGTHTLSITDGHVVWTSPKVGESLQFKALGTDHGQITATAFFTDGGNKQLLTKSF